MGLKKLLGAKLLSAAAAVTIIASFSTLPVLNAAAVGGASDSVKQNENGVIKIESVYGDANYLVSTCTGFIINNSTIVTSKQILPSASADILNEAMGPDFQFDESKLKVRTKISNVYVDATSVLGDSDNNFAVLRLSKAINFDQSDYFDLPLGDSDKLETTETVYSIGYSQTDTSNTPVINEGKISKISKDIIEYTINNPTQGFVGSPVIDESGSVVALTVSLTTDGYKAIPINNIESVLNTFTIEYKSGSSNEISVPELPAEESVQESVNPPAESSVQLPAESSVESTVESSVDSSIEREESVKDESAIVPEEEDEIDYVMIIIIGGIGLVVVAIIVIVIVLATRKKPEPLVQSTPPYPLNQTNNNLNNQSMNRQIPPTTPNQMFNQGAGETTILNDGAGETTILGGSETVGIPSGVLVNIKSGERVVINKPEFAIGKERNRVDYCISDDSSVSRLHLKIRVRAGKCFVVDMNSKNGTFLNGNRLTPNQEYIIQNGDRLKISLIEFEFKG